MVILHLSTWYPHEKKPHFGRFILEHAKAAALVSKQAHHGHQHTLIAVLFLPSDKFWSVVERVEDYPNLKVHVLEVHTRLHQLGNKLSWLCQQMAIGCWTKHYGMQKPMLVHGHVVSPAGVAAYQLSKYWKVPLVITEHWSGVQRLLGQPYFGSQAAKAYQAAKVIVVSDHLADKLMAWVPRLITRPTVVPNVVSPAFQYDPAAAQSSYLVMVMNLVAPKLPQLAVRAVEQLWHNGQWPPGLTLKIIGAGPMMAELRQLVSNHNLPISFLGQLPHHEIISLMNGAHGVLHPTSSETFGLVVAEALQAGVPVLASDIPALAALVAPYSGLLCPNDEEHWATGLGVFLATDWNRAEIAASNKNRFSAEGVGGRFLEVYHTMLS